ncbi:right-handed parallel beta-helix repeat-containing protein [Bacillus sp. FSL K6-3431]|uniref:right-handed parallel beta-helix repeat-containing protein n=1 Tax=Bacillus sp. FSL K6-3431 TaxID=2921500 RepID=UPI0030F7E3D2
MKKWIIISAVLAFMIGAVFLVNSAFKTTAITKTDTKSTVKTPVYELELSRWGVHNDGTHPLETTKGINSALVWAKENGYKTFNIPNGTYLIAKGTKQRDSESRINMVSDMDLHLNEKTILQKEANEFEIYSVLYIGPDVENVTIKGGTFLGDRDHHDYSKKGPDTGGTHEWGNGIEIVGAENVVIDGVKTKEFTGDGIIVSGTNVTGSTIAESSLELGGIDEKGQPVKAEGKIRTNNREVSHFDNPAYETFKNIHFWLPEGITDGSKVDVYYYRKDGSFIKADKQIKFFSGESIIPSEADYFQAVFEAPSIKKVKVNRMTVDISKNVTIMNSDIGYNRRQGISLVGSDGVQIINNHIHHTNGTAPQSGIDIEPGFFPGKNTTIKGNTFTDNKIQIVLAYGENVTIEDNHFEQNIEGGIGVHAHKGFRGEVVVNDNNFIGSGLTLYAGNAKAEGNQFKNGSVKLLGKNIIFSNSTLVDASLSVGNEDGQKISNISIEHNGVRPGILYIEDQAVYLKDVAIKANTKGKDLILGMGNSQSVYERLTVKDSDRQGTVLPAGTYNQCSFEAGGLAINRVGSYVLDDCVVKDKENLLTINSLYGKPEVTLKNSKLEITENIGYGAAIYVSGAENFELLDSMVSAKSSISKSPLIKIGPYGKPKATDVFGVMIKGNELHTKSSVIGVDTFNAGTNAPAYLVQDNKLYNATLKLTSKDIKNNNKTMQK